MIVEIKTQLAAVRRAVRTVELDDDQFHVQIISQQYPLGIDDLWRAVTSSARIARWFVPVSGELRVHGRYQLKDNASGEVLACNGPDSGAASYRVTWEHAGDVTWLAVRLTSVDVDHTRVELEYTARMADVPSEMWETFGPGATGVGWDQTLLGLALHLSAVDEPTSAVDETWQLSDEGKAFTRAAADGWAAAHVAAGADTSEAARAANATYAFYTGTVADT